MKGSEKEPGLAPLAMAEILSMSEEIEKSISISFYEIFQDRVYDLLDPKRPEVQVLENGQGKIQLKGLSQARYALFQFVGLMEVERVHFAFWCLISYHLPFYLIFQVPVKSISEFQKLYISGHSSRKPMQKITMELPRRSHKGLIVRVSSESDALSVGKMNFVDLAGYSSINGYSFQYFISRHYVLSFIDPFFMLPYQVTRILEGRVAKASTLLRVQKLISPYMHCIMLFML